MSEFSGALFDRLLQSDEQPGRPTPSGDQRDRMRACIARDLEGLLNTRTAMPDDLVKSCPHVAASVLNFGLIDFAGMSVGSAEDSARICQAVRIAIERHEPRLCMVSAAIRPHPGVVNRIDFVITAKLTMEPQGDPLRFDAVLEPSSLQYSIRHQRASAR